MDVFSTTPDQLENAREGVICPHCGTELEEQVSPGVAHHPVLLDARNLFAILAAVCFTVSLFIDDKQYLLKAVAYGMGTLAYLGELLAITHAFKLRCTLMELLMPLLFGFVYIMLGLSYVIKHFA